MKPRTRSLPQSHDNQLADRKQSLAKHSIKLPKLPETLPLSPTSSSKRRNTLVSQKSEDVSAEARKDFHHMHSAVLPYDFSRTV